MTRSEWDALGAREKDAVVAEKVMGGGPRYRAVPVSGGVIFERADMGPPDYTTSWEAMGEVVEKMRADGWLPVMKHMPDKMPFIAQGSGSEYAPSADMPIRGSAGKALAEFYWITRDHDEHRERWFKNNTSLADTLPEAVAVAALTALGWMI